MDSMLDIVDDGRFVELKYDAPAYSPNAIPFETFRRDSNYSFRKFMDELRVYALNFGMFGILAGKILLNADGRILTDEMCLSTNLEEYYAELDTIRRVKCNDTSKVLKVYIKLVKPILYTSPIILKSKPKRKYRKRTGIPRGIRNEVFKRDDYTCVQCGAKKGDMKPDGKKVVIHCDHIKPLAKGGDDSMDNLQTLCADCNLNKNDVYQKVGK